MLQRIQLMLDSETKEKLQRIARAQNRSMSEVTREVLKKNLKKAKKGPLGTDFLLKLSESAVSGPGNADYDKYAYEK